MPTYSTPLPGTRTTGDPNPATDMNQTVAAVAELRTKLTTVEAAAETPSGAQTKATAAQNAAKSYADTLFANVNAPSYSNLPAGSTVTLLKNGSTWPARPSARTDLVVIWKGPDPSPSIVNSGTGGMLNNVDVRFVTPS